MAASDEFRESSFSDKVQNDAIFYDLNLQRTTSMFCDVIMKVCDKNIYAHSCILAAASPYFTSFLTQDLPRQFSNRSPQVIEIQIDGGEPGSAYEDAVEAVVDFIYTGNISVTNQTVNQILEISRIMQLAAIEQFCEDFVNGLQNASVVHNKPTDADSLYKANQPGVALENLVQGKDGLIRAVSVRSKQSTQRFSNAIVSRNLLPSTRPSKMHSASTQVTPNLLLEGPKEKVFTDGESQTHESNFTKRFSNQSKKKTLTASHLKSGRIESEKSPEDEENKKTTKETPTKTVHIRIENENAEHEADIQMIAIKDSSSKENNAKDTNEDVEKNPSVENDTGDVKSSAEEQFHALGLEKIKQETGSDVRRSKRQVKPTEKAQMWFELSPPSKKRGLQSDDEERSSQSVPDDGNDVKGKRKKRQHVSYYKFKCKECSFLTNRLADIQNHAGLHFFEKCVCHFCELNFKTKEELKTHLEKHSKPRPFFCPYCDMRFKNRTQLNIHIPKHLNEKPFKCDICGAAFKWKHALKNHGITHSNVKKLLCDLCGYATSHKSQLKAHRLIHTGDTFKCTYEDCTFQATKRQNLKYHMLTHTREKPHQCEMCGQGFSLGKNLRRHVLLHSKEKPHKCEYCDFASTRYDKLREHHLKMHGVGTPPERRIKISEQVELARGARYMKSSLNKSSLAITPRPAQEAGAVPEQIIAMDSLTSVAVAVPVDSGETLATEDPLESTLVSTGEAIDSVPAEDVQENAIEYIQQGQTIIIQTADGETSEVTLMAGGQNGAITELELVPVSDTAFVDENQTQVYVTDQDMQVSEEVQDSDVKSESTSAI